MYLYKECSVDLLIFISKILILIVTDFIEIFNPFYVNAVIFLITGHSLPILELLEALFVVPFQGSLNDSNRNGQIMNAGLI